MMLKFIQIILTSVAVNCKAAVMSEPRYAGNDKIGQSLEQFTSIVQKRCYKIIIRSGPEHHLLHLNTRSINFPIQIFGDRIILHLETKKQDNNSEAETNHMKKQSCYALLSSDKDLNSALKNYKGDNNYLSVYSEHYFLLWLHGGTLEYYKMCNSGGDKPVMIAKNIDSICRPRPEISPNIRAMVPFGIPFMPYIDCEERRNGLACWGIMPSLLQILADKMNRSYTFINDQHNPFGFLSDGNGDVHISGYTIRHARWGTVDFGFPFITKSTFIYTKTAESKVSSTGLYNVFEPVNYSIYLLSVIVMCLLFAFFLYKDDKQTASRYAYAIFNLLTALFYKTYPESRLPRGTPRLIIQWYLYSMMLTTMYSSVLINQLSYLKPDVPINNLEDIYKKNYVPLMWEGSSVRETWTESNNPITEALSHRVQNFSDNSEAIMMMMEVGRSLLMDESLAQYELQKWQKFYQEKPPVWKSNTPYQNGLELGSWIFAKHSPEKNRMSHYLQRCYETGLYEKIEREISPFVSEVGVRFPPPKKLAFDHFQLLFYSWAGVIVLACIFFVLELIFPPKQKATEAMVTCD